MLIKIPRYKYMNQVVQYFIYSRAKKTNSIAIVLFEYSCKLHHAQLYSYTKYLDGHKLRNYLDVKSDLVVSSQKQPFDMLYNCWPCGYTAQCTHDIHLSDSFIKQGKDRCIKDAWVYFLSLFTYTSQLYFQHLFLMEVANLQLHKRLNILQSTGT